jgi:hypothetical protein
MPGQNSADAIEGRAHKGKEGDRDECLRGRDDFV